MRRSALPSVVPDGRSCRTDLCAARHGRPARQAWRGTPSLTRRVNFREGWRGCLVQVRFASYLMDDGYLMTAMRYVE